MFRRLDRGILFGVMLLAALILGIAISSVMNIRYVRSSAELAVHSREILDAIGSIEIETRKLQAGQRAFIINGAEERLVPFHEASLALRRIAEVITTLTVNDPHHHANVAKVKIEIERGLKNLNEINQVRREQGIEGILAISKQRGSRSFVDPLLETLDEMAKLEKQNLAMRDIEADKAYERATFYGIAAGILGLAALGFFFMLLVRSDARQQATKAKLNEQRELLKSTITSIGDGVIATDTQGRITFLNTVAESLTGWKSEEAQDLPLEQVFTIVNETTRAKVDNPTLRALSEGAIVGLANHTILIARDGTERPIDDSAAPIITSGEVSGAVLVFRDITDRKRDEQALRESEAGRRLALEAAELGSWHLDPVTFELTTDQRFRDIFGIPGDAMQYKPAIEMIHPEDRERVHHAVMASTRPDDPVPYSIEYRVIHPDESIRWVQAKGRANFSGVGSNRKLNSFDGTLADITERKRSEESLRFLSDASASLAELVDYESTLGRIANLAVGNFADWCVVDILDASCERRRLVATKPNLNEINQKSRNRLLNDADPDSILGIPHVLKTGEPEVFSDLAESIERKEISDERVNRLNRSGIRSYLSVPLLSRGRVLGSMTFLSVSGSRRYAQEELRVAQDLAQRVTIAIENSTLYRTLHDQDRRKDEFLATLAHELRNPLAPIRNGVVILSMGKVDKDVEVKTLEMMDRQLSHLVHLVDDLMDVSRVSSGKVVLRNEYFDLQDIIGNAMETSRELIEKGGHKLEVQLPEQRLSLFADRTRIIQVLANLINNAAKYTPNNGRISVTGEIEATEAVIRVKDTGIGIPAEMLPRIFEMFTQIGTSLDRAQGGLGIGLTLVKRLVEMHGGQIAVRSDGAGTGSEFIVRLPYVAQKSDAEDAAPVTESTLIRKARQLRILVVDDNRDAAATLAMLLKFHGHEIKVAHDGPEAIRVLETFHPRLILLDLGLPGMSGYDVAKRIRASAVHTGVTIAALTGWGQDEDRRRTKEAGFDFHIVKPADPDEVEKIIASIAK